MVRSKRIINKLVLFFIETKDILVPSVTKEAI